MFKAWRTSHKLIAKTKVIKHWPLTFRVKAFPKNSSWMTPSLEMGAYHFEWCTHANVHARTCYSFRGTNVLRREIKSDVYAKGFLSFQVWRRHIGSVATWSLTSNTYLWIEEDFLVALLYGLEIWRGCFPISSPHFRRLLSLQQSPRRCPLMLQERLGGRQLSWEVILILPKVCFWELCYMFFWVIIWVVNILFCRGWLSYSGFSICR